MKGPKYIDVLEEDKQIAGQKFVCLSFLTPEKILKQKNMFFFNEFVKEWDMHKSMEKYTQFLNFLSYKNNLSFDEVSKDLEDFCKSEKEKLFTTTLEDEYKNFLDRSENDLEEKFSKEHNFQTNVQGVKVRGTYPTQQEAELRCKMLREVDPNHDVYVGPVGVWMPFHPDAYKTGRVEYLESELNQLMHEKNKNEKHAKLEFEKRLRETKEKAIKENEEIALKSGNKLTQTLNENGELVSVKDMNTTESNLQNKEDVNISDIKAELFEGENVVLDKNTDHGLSEVRKLHGIKEGEEEDGEDGENEEDGEEDE